MKENDIPDCPNWEKCNNFKCHDQGVCMNGDYWARWHRAKHNPSASLLAPKVKGSCYYCERPFSGRNIFKTRDHIIPVSKGGKNFVKNIVDCCARCNLLKSNMLLEDFMDYLGQLIQSGKTHISRNMLVTIVYNSRELIKKIEPYRSELYKFISEDVAVVEERQPIILREPPKPTDPIQKWRESYALEEEPNFHTED